MYYKDKKSFKLNLILVISLIFLTSCTPNSKNQGINSLVSSLASPLPSNLLNAIIATPTPNSLSSPTPTVSPSSNISLITSSLTCPTGVFLKQYVVDNVSLDSAGRMFLSALNASRNKVLVYLSSCGASPQETSVTYYRNNGPSVPLGFISYQGVVIGLTQLSNNQPNLFYSTGSTVDFNNPPLTLECSKILNFNNSFYLYNRKGGNDVWYSINFDPIISDKTPFKVNEIKDLTQIPENLKVVQSNFVGNNINFLCYADSSGTLYLKNYHILKNIPSSQAFSAIGSGASSCSSFNGRLYITWLSGGLSVLDASKVSSLVFPLISSGVKSNSYFPLTSSVVQNNANNNVFN